MSSETGYTRVAETKGKSLALLHFCETRSWGRPRWSQSGSCKGRGQLPPVAEGLWKLGRANSPTKAPSTPACAACSAVRLPYLVSDFNSTNTSTTGFLGGTVNTLTPERWLMSGAELIKGGSLYEYSSGERFKN